MDANHILWIGLGFDPNYYAFLQALGSIGNLIGVFFYGKYLARIPLRYSLAGVHIALAVAGVFDTILALRFNVEWQIDDKYEPMTCTLATIAGGLTLSDLN